MWTYTEMFPPHFFTLSFSSTRDTSDSLIVPFVAETHNKVYNLRLRGVYYYTRQ